MQPSGQRRNIGLFFHRHIITDQLQEIGIYHFARPRKNWEIFVNNAEVSPITVLQRFQLDGAIAQVGRVELAAVAKSLKIPFVNIYGGLPFEGLSQVGVDDQAIGEMAAEHLAGCSFRHFAFWGFGGRGFSRGRWLGFRRRLRQLHFEPTRYLKKKYYPKLPITYPETVFGTQHIFSWLASLPKPVAIFACDDTRGQWLAEACRNMGLRVPETVALLGVNNNRLHCYEAYPPLSSIELPAEMVGFRAAQMLDRLMSGRPVKSPILLPPERVIVRQSTDVLAVDDPELAKAVRYIRLHACEGIRVRDAVAQSGISRCLLERRFQNTLQCTPFEEIRRVQLERVRELLRTTPDTIDQIADKCGFSGRVRLSQDFRKRTGQTLSEYRNQFRAPR
jgi:LacI family transcriptional regulator